MGFHNRRTPDHHKPQPRVALPTHLTHTPAPQRKGRGKAKGKSNRLSPVWYIAFVAAIASLLTAVFAH